VIVTFYSYKGGVGRSMAMVNVGEILADWGYRVVLCDWDLEAPGLERYVVERDVADPGFEDELRTYVARPGLMDLLREYKEALCQPPRPADDRGASADPATHTEVGELVIRRPSSYAVTVSTSRTRSGSLRLLTAGNRDGDAGQRYGEDVRSFDWNEFYEKWAGDSYIEFLRRDLRGAPDEGVPGAADIVLVDSRTGVTEQGGVCTHHLADLVVLFTAANDVNFRGTRWMAQALTQPRLEDLRGGRRLGVMPVASRIEQTSQKDEVVDFRHRFRDEFSGYLRMVVGDAEKFALASEVPYMPFYAFRERVVAREAPERREQKLYAAYLALADGIVRYGIDARLLAKRPFREDAVRTSAREPAATAPTPGWDHAAFVHELNEAVQAYDRSAVAAMCERFTGYLARVSDPYPAAEGDVILALLQRGRRFDLVQQVADALIESGQRAPRIRRRQAQAFIEQGNLSAALALLESLAGETREEPLENAETRALIGRVYKERYLETATQGSDRSRRNLERALAFYYEVYRAGPSVYTSYGIDVVALLCRADRDGIVVEGFPDARQMAQEILRMVESNPGPSARDCATAAEACLALGSAAAAVEWMGRYVGQPDVDAFGLAGTLRQLTEVWQIDAAVEPGTRLLPLLRAHLLTREGGRVDVPATDVRRQPAAPLQGVLARDSGVTQHWYVTGTERMRAVAKLRSGSGQPSGTGFITRGSDLHVLFGGEWVLLTAAHLLAPAADAPSGALGPADVVVEFEALRDAGVERYRVAAVLWTSPVGALDTCIVRLDPPVTFDGPAYPIAPRLPLTDGTQRVYVIGHPGGRDLSFSLHDNVLLAADDRVLHYRAATEAGSSGSPVFNQLWQLIGMHHAASSHMRRLHGEGTYEACEGIWIQAVSRQLRAELGSYDQAPAPWLQPEAGPGEYNSAQQGQA
jgi:hypothetical protein